jgi:hypothetical protein
MEGTMTDAATMRALIERVEQAAGPHRGLSWDILFAVNVGKTASMVAFQDYTASLDAAASLVRAGQHWQLHYSPFDGEMWGYATVGYEARSGRCATPALALTAAALRELLAEMEAVDDA